MNSFDDSITAVDASTAARRDIRSADPGILTAGKSTAGGAGGDKVSADDLAMLDLNMLVALRALLQERSVTRAATRLALGQPATSAALRRLRTHFGDPLLIRDGASYELSPLATALLGGVEATLATAESVFLNGAGFQPAVSRRTFTIVAADEALVHIGERLLPRMADFPTIGLDVVALTDAAVHHVDATLRAMDALVLPRGVIAGYCTVDLWADEYLLAVGENSALDADNLTPEKLGGMQWVSSFHGTPPVVAALEAWGVPSPIRVQVVVPSFATLPMLLARSTRHVALIQRRLADRLRGAGGIRILPGPPLAPPFKMALWWHANRDQDAGHAWLRALITEVTSDMRD